MIQRSAWISEVKLDVGEFLGSLHQFPEILNKMTSITAEHEYLLENLLDSASCKPSRIRLKEIKG